MPLTQITPIFRSFDEVKAREFYLDFLEFKLDWEHRFEDDLPLYMQVSKGACAIHLSEHYGDCTPGSAIRIETEDLESYQKLLMSKKYKHSRPSIKTMPWGTKDMTISDPFGNKLIFTMPASSTSHSHV